MKGSGRVRSPLILPAFSRAEFLHHHRGFAIDKFTVCFQYRKSNRGKRIASLIRIFLEGREAVGSARRCSTRGDGQFAGEFCGNPV